MVKGFSVYILVHDIKLLILSLQRENTKVQQSRVEIQRIAHHDFLTHLPNRFYGEELFSHSLKTGVNKQQNLALLFYDLDDFKPVNDAFGHAAGDPFLEQLIQHLSETLQPDQYLIRFVAMDLYYFRRSQMTAAN